VTGRFRGPAGRPCYRRADGRTLAPSS